jgi:hypothetical protein
MKLTVLRDDRCIIKDGKPLFFDFQMTNPVVRAIQWTGSSGHCEYNNAPNELITEGYIAPYVAVYDAEADRLDAISQAELDFYNSPGQVALRQAEVDQKLKEVSAIETAIPSFKAVEDKIDSAVLGGKPIEEIAKIVKDLLRVVVILTNRPEK